MGLVKKFSVSAHNVSIIIVLLSLICSAVAAPVAGEKENQEMLQDETTNDEIDIEGINKESESAQVIIRFSNPNITNHQQHKKVKKLKKKAKKSQQSFISYSNNTAGIDVKNRFWITNAVLARIDLSKVDVSSISERPAVTRVHKNYQVKISRISSSKKHVKSNQLPSLSNKKSNNNRNTPLSSISQISAPDVWNSFTARGANTTIAVLDTGVDTTNHPDIRLASGGWKDFVNNRDTPYDDNGHGTHVSGIVVGGRQSDGTSYGVAPNASLIHTKVFAADGTSNISLILDGIEWAVANDADVISMSLGGQPNVYISDFISPIQNARDSGVLFVGVAGNSGSSTSSAPGNVYGVLSTGAVAADGTVAKFSGGEKIDTQSAWGTAAPSQWPDQYIVPVLSAPGVRISSAASGGGYTNKSGTSMAAPHVAGTIALMQSATDKHLSDNTITTALRETAEEPPNNTKYPNNRYGYGIINASAATVSVSTPAMYNITYVTFPDIVISNDTYNVDVTIDNTGDAVGSQNITYKLVADSGKIRFVDNKSVKIADGSSVDLQFVVPPVATTSIEGNYTHIIETPADKRIVEFAVDPSAIPSGAVYSDPKGVSAQFDTDDNGEISQNEVTIALNSYVNKSLTQSEVTQVLNSYVKSTT